MNSREPISPWVWATSDAGGVPSRTLWSLGLWPGHLGGYTGSSHTQEGRASTEQVEGWSKLPVAPSPGQPKNPCQCSHGYKTRTHLSEDQEFFRVKKDWPCSLHSCVTLGKLSSVSEPVSPTARQRWQQSLPPMVAVRQKIKACKPVCHMCQLLLPPLMRILGLNWTWISAKIGHPSFLLLVSEECIGWNVWWSENRRRGKRILWACIGIFRDYVISYTSWSLCKCGSVHGSILELVC